MPAELFPARARTRLGAGALEGRAVRREIALQRQHADLLHYQPRVCISSDSGSLAMSRPGMASPSARLASSSFSGSLIVLGRLHDGLGARRRIGRFEDARSDEHRFGAELHHQRRIGRSGDAARREIRHRQLAVLAPPIPPVRAAPRSSLASCTSSSLPSTVSCFISLTMVRMWRTASTMLPEPASPLVRIMAAPSAMRRSASPRLRAPQTNGTLKSRLVDVVLFVGGREHFALVDVIDAQRFQNARFHEVADARLGHHRNGDRAHDLFDDGDVGHARHAAFFADIGRHALQRHHGAGARVFGDLGLLGVGDVHDDAALQHLRQSDLYSKLLARKLKHFVVYLPIHNTRFELYTMAGAGSSSRTAPASSAETIRPRIARPSRISRRRQAGETQPQPARVVPRHREITRRQIN